MDGSNVQDVSGTAMSSIDETAGRPRSANCPELSSPVLQLSEVEEILEHSEIVPQLRQDESSMAHLESSGASERDACDSQETSAAEEETAEDDSSDTMTESQEDVLSTARTERRRSSVMDGLWACLSPVTSLWKSREKAEEEGGLGKDGSAFEIPFADIKELEFIGSGAQGAVFSGEYRGEKIAVKKVKDKSYCDEICQLRKLSHRNIVQFR